MLKANGYKNVDIKILSDEKATKKQIVKEFQNLASKTRPGDHIYIHLSGHGQQMIDDSGDEADGLDEAFVPYDAQFRYKPGLYEGENHLRDDELELLIDAIRIRAGENGNVIVLLDACHSGTGNRDLEEDEYIRGTSYIFSHPNSPETVSAGGDGENLRFALKKTPGLSPATVFSACQSDQLNYEYRTDKPVVYYGSLSFFFHELMKDYKTTDSTGSFYLRLKERMESYSKKKNRQQTPYFESTDNEKLFTIKKTDSYVR